MVWLRSRVFVSAQISRTRVRTLDHHAQSPVASVDLAGEKIHGTSSQMLDERAGQREPRMVHANHAHGMRVYGKACPRLLVSLAKTSLQVFIEENIFEAPASFSDVGETPRGLHVRTHGRERRQR